MIYFLRHGLDDELYIGGWSNLDLLPEGVEQIKNTISVMKESGINIKRIISSDVKRAKTSASLVADAYGISEVEINPEFNEQNKGLLNGMLKETLPKEYEKYRGKNVEINTVFPEGESLIDLYERIKKFLPTIMELEDDTLIVTHRGVINMIYYILNDIELDMNKKKFNVNHASLHGLDKNNKTIFKLF